MDKTLRTKKQAGPDAWLVLVLKSMPVAELEAEIANPDNSEAEKQWMRLELARRS